MKHLQKFVVFVSFISKIKQNKIFTNLLLFKTQHNAIYFKLKLARNLFRYKLSRIYAVMIYLIQIIRKAFMQFSTNFYAISFAKNQEFV